MKISYGMIVVDGMPFIKHQLNLVYEHAHQIIICEGGDDFWVKINGHRRSKDGTIEFIKNFPDPKNKIKLIQKDWHNKNEMCHEYSKHVTGDILWHLDIDEFVDPAKIPTILQAFKMFPRTQILSIPNLVFWGDCDTLVEAMSSNGWNRTWFNFERIFRFKKGYYIHHIPERGYFDPRNKKVLPAPILGGEYFIERGIYTYHFSYVLPEAVQMKMRYYNHRIPGCIKDNWYERTFCGFKANKKQWIDLEFNVEPINESKHAAVQKRLQPLGHKLPPFLAPLIKDLQ
jgi:hypothetical protein